MRLAQKQDIKLVVDTLVGSFRDNPGVNWMFSDNGNRDRKIRRLAEYAFVKCFNDQGVYISSNNKGVALLYRGDRHKVTLEELFYEVRFGLSSLPLGRIREVTRREALRKQRRPNSEPYYFFWFLGVLKDGAHAGFELEKGVKEIASKRGIPIYIETAMERNKTAYERMGYETYDFWNDPTKNIQFWFMRWPGHSTKPLSS